MTVKQQQYMSHTAISWVQLYVLIYYALDLLFCILFLIEPSSTTVPHFTHAKLCYGCVSTVTIPSLMCERWVLVPSVIVTSFYDGWGGCINSRYSRSFTSTFLAIVLYAGTLSANQMQLNLVRRMNSSLKHPVFEIQTLS